MNKYLLPSGFRDLLFSDAEAEFFTTVDIIKYFFSHKYRLVSTPLLEFEDSLFEGSGKILQEKTLKLNDPQSMKTLGIRADITPQISRLVASRLSNEKLPMRLCYFGNIIRSEPANTKGERQLKQIGLEIIEEKPKPASDAEVINIAANALKKVGLKNITIDINTPNLLNNIMKLSEDDKRAIAKKDFLNIPKQVRDIVMLAGNAENALKINTKALNTEAKQQINYLREVYETLIKLKTKANITIDFSENRGFDYHKTISFSFFAENIRDELGRGGRYNINNLCATGFTLYLNTFLDKLKIE